MLNIITFEVLNSLLDGNVFSTDCHFSSTNNRRMLYITTRQKLTEEEFLKLTKDIISIKDISCIDEFSISIDLSHDLIKNFNEYASYLSYKEFVDMKK